MSDKIWVSTFQRLHQRLQRIAGSMLHDDDEAQDVLQDAFCRLWTNYRDIESEQQAEALSVTTVKNLSISNLRSRKNGISSYSEDETAETVCDEESNSQEREEQFQFVQKLIDKHLSPLQRHILNSRELKGETTQEIARELGMEETAVRMNLSRARRTIRDIYKQTQR